MSTPRVNFPPAAATTVQNPQKTASVVQGTSNIAPAVQSTTTTPFPPSVPQENPQNSDAMDTTAVSAPTSPIENREIGQDLVSRVLADNGQAEAAPKLETPGPLMAWEWKPKFDNWRVEEKHREISKVIRTWSREERLAACNLELASYQRSMTVYRKAFEEALAILGEEKADLVDQRIRLIAIEEDMD